MTRRSNDTVAKLASEGYCKRATRACSMSVLRACSGDQEGDEIARDGVELG